MREGFIVERVAASLLALTLSAPLVASAAGPQREAAHAFEHYVFLAEERMQGELGPSGRFLYMDGLAPAERQDVDRRLHAGEVIKERRDAAAATRAPGAIIHDWVGTVFIPGVSVDQVLSLIQDYDRHQQYFAPQVVRSKLLNRVGDRFDVYLRLQQTKIITVVFDTRHDVLYTRLDAGHAYSRSYSTSIREIQNPGERDERELPVAQDHGFIWRLDSYWRFAAANGGVYVQCEALSLTRDIPVGLGWMIGPFLESIPRDSLEFTLRGTRAAVLAGLPHRSGVSE